MHIPRPLSSIAASSFRLSPDTENKTGALLIERFLELDDWSILEITDEIPFDTQMTCPADDSEIVPICTLVGNASTRKIRIGSCPSCGYIGYMDRPSKAWITQFYAEKWDNGSRVNNESEVLMRRNAFSNKSADPFMRNVRERELTDLVNRYSIRKDRPVLDIGCGYGTSLKFLEKLGFKSIYGVENSRHRASIASSAYDIPTFTGAFEDSMVQQACQKVGPFGLITSHHVMEHVYDPQEIIRLAADLQEEGDHLVMSLPNVKGEPSMQTIVYFPHLHLFGKKSFGRLLERYGYEVLDISFTNRRQLFFLARKRENGKKQYQLSEENTEWVKDKFTHSIGLGTHHWFGRRRLWWYRPLGIDSGGQIPFFGNTMLDGALYNMRLGLDRLMRKRRSLVRQSCVVRNVQARRISERESPLEIQFEGNILVTYK